jgi:hypothetical protein
MRTVLTTVGVVGDREDLICRVTYLALEGPFHHTE